MRRASAHVLTMARRSQALISPLIVVIAALGGAAGAWLFFSSSDGTLVSSASSVGELRAGSTSFQLVGDQPPDMVWGTSSNLQVAAPDAKMSPAPMGADIRPIRTIQDPYPMLAGIAVDGVNNEVAVADQNLFNLLVFDRTIDSTGIAEPRRKIGGPKTKILFICGVEIDPVNREIYTVNNDIMDNMLVFAHEQRGDVAAARELKVDHGAWGVSLDRDHDEVGITVQHINKVAIYRRTAQGDEAPLRILQGPRTGLADPHGIFLDGKNDEIFVTNHGSWHMVATGKRDLGIREILSRFPDPPLIPSTGQFEPPSIKVYARAASGDAAPLRVIQGPKTRLNLPLGVYVDQAHDQIAVANDGGDSILFFSRTARGDVAPVRTLEGPATGLKNPVGVYLDAQHDELWVSNWGNRTATVYKRTAQGNTPPLRTVRVAPREEPVLGFGNLGAVAYDPLRDQLLVPN